MHHVPTLLGLDMRYFSSNLQPQGVFGLHFENQPIGDLSLKNMGINSTILNHWKMLLYIILGYKCRLLTVTLWIRGARFGARFWVIYIYMVRQAGWASFRVQDDSSSSLIPIIH